MDTEIFYPMSYYLKVQDDLKYGALQGMIGAIDPHCLIVMVACEELACTIAADWGCKYSFVVKGGSLPGDIGASMANNSSHSAKKPGFIIINDEIPPFPYELKTLLICCDNLPIHYTDGQNTSEVKIVNFISDEKDIHQEWREVDPFLYGFFHSQGMLLSFLPLFL